MKSELKRCLSTGEALRYCAIHEYPLTRPGLIYIGQQHGFISKGADHFHWIVDMDGLKAYVKKATAFIPASWVTVKTAAYMLNYSLAWVYDFIADGMLKSKYMGAGKGVQYVKVNDIKRIIDQYS